MESPYFMLPIDVIGLFKGMFSLRDAKSLRLTSPIFADMFAPDVLHTLTLNVSGKTYQRELDILKLLASGRTRAIQETKILKIRSLTTRTVFADWYYMRTSEYTLEDVAPSEEELKKCFFRGLSQLKRVEFISWTPHPFYEKIWAYDDMNRLLKQLPNLRHFEISLYYLTVYVPEAPPFAPTPLHVPFEDMTTLRSIKLTGIRSFHENFSRFCSLIHRFRDLEDIYLELQHPLPDVPGSDVLLILLSQYPADLPPLQLKSMTMHGTIPRISSVLLPHLRMLKSLRIKVGLMQDDTLSSFDALWNALRVEDIHLEHLSSPFALPALLLYIESYRGLKGISFSQMFDGTPTAEDRDRFFSSLLIHKDSLEELDIAPVIDSGVREGAWCASLPRNAAIYGQLKNLRKARVGVKGLLPLIGQSGDKSETVLTLVIEAFLKLPRMERLRLDTQEECRGATNRTACVVLRNAVRSYVRRIAYSCSTMPLPPFVIKYEHDAYKPHRIGRTREAETWKYLGDRLGEEFDKEPYQLYVYRLDLWEETAHIEYLYNGENTAGSTLSYSSELDSLSDFASAQ